MAFEFRTAVKSLKKDVLMMMHVLELEIIYKKLYNILS